MKKKLLCFALLAGFGMAAQAASAQTYDDRWYVGAGAGVFAGDHDRNIADDVYGMVGVGKMITPHIAIDAELWHTNPDINVIQFPPNYVLDVTGRNWELTSLSIVGRYFFTSDSRTWSPYIVAGIGAQEHHDGTIVFTTGAPPSGFNSSRTGSDVNWMLGIGAQFDLGYPYVRTEIGARYDTDDGGEGHDNHGYLDGYAGFEFIFPIGPEAVAAPPPPPPPPAKTCADMDDDGDGINNCDDKCPAQAGVAPDGCPAPESEPAPPPKPFRG